MAQSQEKDHTHYADAERHGAFQNQEAPAWYPHSTTLIVPFAFGVVSISPLAAQTNASQQAPGPLRIIAVKRNASGSPMTKITHVGDETTITNTTARNLIQMAYSLKDYQLTGGPSWLDKERFDLTLSGDSTGGTNNLVSNAAIKEVLSQDFHLILKQETKPGPIYALVMGSGGARFSPTTPANAPGTNEPLLSMRVIQKDGQGQITITGGPAGLADALSAQVGVPWLIKPAFQAFIASTFIGLLPQLHPKALRRIYSSSLVSRSLQRRDPWWLQSSTA